MIVTPSDPDIQTIVVRIMSGDLDLQPDFQRGEVWPLIKKKKLIDSILRGWHIPPIHVVVSEGGYQEVLDGQQRLVSIRDFVEGHFPIDGNLEPIDPAIQELHGLHYKELPSSHRRAFDQYSLRVFRLTDFSPEEPGELFFRLNQITALTSAEQRNAFVGPVRDQVRWLVKHFESLDSSQFIGFINRRMALDDVIAKLLILIECESLSIKLTANMISSRFRSKQPFGDAAHNLAKECVNTLVQISAPNKDVVTFNKATLFSWLAFLIPFLKAGRLAEMSFQRLAIFQRSFEIARATDRTGNLFKPAEHHITSMPLLTERGLLELYTDRASFRVSDVSSVIFRDFLLWLFYSTYNWKGDAFIREEDLSNTLSNRKRSLLKTVKEEIRYRSGNATEITLDELVDQRIWGDLE